MPDAFGQDGKPHLVGDRDARIVSTCGLRMEAPPYPIYYQIIVAIGEGDNCHRFSRTEMPKNLVVTPEWSDTVARDLYTQIAKAGGRCDQAALRAAIYEDARKCALTAFLAPMG